MIKRNFMRQNILFGQNIINGKINKTFHSVNCCASQKFRKAFTSHPVKKDSIIRSMQKGFNTNLNLFERNNLLSNMNMRLFHIGSEQKTKQTFDYIIVGAGSAGCVLTNRLLADNKTTINLLEAGSTDNHKSIQMPLEFLTIMSKKEFNWSYQTKPQIHFNNRTHFYPRGKVIGGSSSINGMVYMRGHPYDYNRWENEGASGWSYADCLPYFKKAQNHELGSSLYRGGNGPLFVSRSKYFQELHEIWIKAGVQAGYSRSDDVNGYKQEGFGHFDSNVHDGVRWSSSKAYLEPVINNKNLTVSTNCLATKVIFNGKKAVGVQILNKEGNLEDVIANKEIILCGGAINSPQLLMLSGLGDADDLKMHSIKVLENIPGVGKNFQDHPAIIVAYRCLKPITLFSLHETEFRKKVYEEWELKKTGIGTSAHLGSGGFIRSEANVEHPDIQLHFIPGLIIDHGRQEMLFHSFQSVLTPLRSQSKGCISLQSADPRQDPIIDPNYCSTNKDFQDFITAIKFTREIFAQPAFGEVKGEEVYPGGDVQSDRNICECIKNKCEYIYHPTSTCKMGATNDNNTVVDSQCRVVGIDNLRVVDASVMPSIVSGNTNAPTMMIAEKVADMILGKTPLPRIENAPVWRPRNPMSQREAD